MTFMILRASKRQNRLISLTFSIWGAVMILIIYLFSVNTFTPIERCAIIFVIAQAEKLLIGQKLQNCARCNSSLIGQ